MAERLTFDPARLHDPSARLELPLTAEQRASLAGLVRELVEEARRTCETIERHLREREGPI